MSGEKGPAIGIDLGTTYSCVGVWRNQKVEIISNNQGNRTTPSYVAFTENERLVGEAAKNQASSNPKNTVFDAKRLIGRNFDDKSVQSDMKHWPFKVINDNGKPIIEVQYREETKRFKAEEISSMVLGKMKEVKTDARTHTSDRPRDAFARRCACVSLPSVFLSLFSVFRRPRTTWVSR